MVAQEIHKEGHEMKDMLEVLRHAKQKKHLQIKKNLKMYLWKFNLQMQH